VRRLLILTSTLVLWLSPRISAACVDLELPGEADRDLRTVVIQAHAESDVVVLATVERSYLGPFRREKYTNVPLRDVIVHWRVKRQWKGPRVHSRIRTSEIFTTCTRSYEKGAERILYFNTSKRGSFSSYSSTHYDLEKRPISDQVKLLDSVFGGR
jgi:hypothetical protein